MVLRKLDHTRGDDREMHCFDTKRYMHVELGYGEDEVRKKK